ncbi:tetratricopeptide repeat protein [Vreelandella subglaciescola]|uniref:TRAP transporter T-component n=1 Tax=Vreelandella subglaciescola TaxID=29571 RepID=A0A1M7FD29_9GAMM|nr:TRAP transporter TatT component family protein [Halomonas subglaciescola]SHM01567.1 TRAP transporter T-component [Halomonas subglaciescola]
MRPLFIQKTAMATALAGVVALSSLTLSSAAFGDDPSGFFELKNRVEYTLAEVPEGQREATLKALVEDVNALAEKHPDNAEVLVWQGLVLAAYAGERGGLGALGDAKAARQALERAIQLDPDGNNGSAYVTLGILYARVPGGLVSFGDSDKADQMFQRALAVRPDGIDVNYYYATFLADEDRTQAARQHAQQAVNGTAREARRDSDETLRDDARSLLETL